MVSISSRSLMIFIVLLYLLVILIDTTVLSSARIQTCVGLGLVYAHARQGRCFAEFATAVQNRTPMTVVCRGAPRRPIATPHFILLNHIRAYARSASFVAAAGIVGHRPCRIVCYDDYRRFWQNPIARTFNQVLMGDIRINRRLTNAQKESAMVRGIADTFRRGENVVMFIDPHMYAKKTPMRALHHKVLSQFPTVWKQVIHLYEPDGGMAFPHRAMEPVLSVEAVVNQRTILISESVQGS